MQELRWIPHFLLASPNFNFHMRELDKMVVEPLYMDLKFPDNTGIT